MTNLQFFFSPLQFNLESLLVKQLFLGWAVKVQNTLCLLIYGMSAKKTSSFYKINDFLIFCRNQSIVHPGRISYYIPRNMNYLTMLTPPIPAGRPRCRV